MKKYYQHQTVHNIIKLSKKIYPVIILILEFKFLFSSTDYYIAKINNIIYTSLHSHTIDIDHRTLINSVYEMSNNDFLKVLLFFSRCFILGCFIMLSLLFTAHFFYKKKYEKIILENIRIINELFNWLFNMISWISLMTAVFALCNPSILSTININIMMAGFYLLQFITVLKIEPILYKHTLGRRSIDEISGTYHQFKRTTD